MSPLTSLGPPTGAAASSDGPKPGEARLHSAIRRFHPIAPRSPPPLKPDPTNAWEIAVAERLKTIESDIAELKSWLRWLFTLILGAAVANVVVALLQP